MYVCTICNLFAGQSFSTVLRHMGTHRYNPGLRILCGINSCTEHYDNFESFRSHVYRKHREALAPVPHTVASHHHVSEMLDLREIHFPENYVDHETTAGRDEQKKLAALFLLKTREERKVTQVALNGIIQDFRGIWRDGIERLQVRVYSVLF